MHDLASHLNQANVIGISPSMALDTRVPADMTTLGIFRTSDRLQHILPAYGSFSP
jgi:hypothetical protein